MRRRQADPAVVNREPAPPCLTDPRVEDYVDVDEHLADPLAEANVRMQAARRLWEARHPLPSADPRPTSRRPEPLPADQQERYNTSHGRLTIAELRLRSLGDSCTWRDYNAFAAAVTGDTADQDRDDDDIEAL